MNTIDIIEEIISKNDINCLTFYEYPDQKIIQEELRLSEADRKIISKALDVRKSYKLPFWDSLLLSSFYEKGISGELLQSVLKHNSNCRKINTLDVNEIKEIINSENSPNLSFNSEVHFSDGAVAHIFMIDFHIPISDENLLIISGVLEALNLNGYILDSGESYHFICDSFTDSKSLLTLLGKSLLFAPIVDRAWIAHQIIERSCSLRVGKKHGKFPTLITRV